MLLTIVLALKGCALLFLMIWEATVTMPFSALAKNFPLDVQERLKPRLESMPLTPKIKVFDIVGLDFFLLTKTRFFQHYLPETEGCAGWKQFGYNRKQQTRQCIIIPICCLLSAAVFAYLV